MKKLILGITAISLVSMAAIANANSEYDSEYGYGDTEDYYSAPEFYPAPQQKSQPVKKARGIQFYIQGEAGYIWQSHKKDIGDGISDKSKHFGGGGSIGVLFPLNPTFSIGLQTGFNYYGETIYQMYNDRTRDTIDLITNKTMAIDALAIAKISLGQFSIIGGGGVAYEMNKFNTWTGTFSPQEGDSIDLGSDGKYFNSFRPEVMAGASFNITRNIAVGVIYKYIFGNEIMSDDWLKNEDSMKKVSINAVMATVTFSM